MAVDNAELAARIWTAESKLRAELARLCDELDEATDQHRDEWHAPRARYLAGLVRGELNRRPYDHERVLDALADFLAELPGRRHKPSDEVRDA